MARTTRTDTIEDAEARYRDLFRHSDHAVLIADKERILALNDAATILAGAIPAALMALAVHGLFEVVDRVAVPRGLRIRAQAYLSRA